jgi:hypothetical protein
MDQDKETNPIAEIFDEVFTLMADVETRSIALFEYMQEQGGVTDEKLAPYLDRAAAASDVRWRAARARMEHLLAPKPKSATDTGKDEKTKGDAEPQAKNKDAQGQDKREQKAKPESKDLGKELASAQPGEAESEAKDNKSKAAGATNTANSSTDARSIGKEQGDRKHGQDKASTTDSSDSGSQASALAGEKNSDARKSDIAMKSSDEGSTRNQTADTDKPQTQKAPK